MCKTSRKGFTLFEILIVISILGILSAIIMNTLNSTKQKANIAKATLTVKQIRNAVALLEQETGQWPGHVNGNNIASGVSGNEIWDLNAGEAGLVANDDALPFQNWSGPYFANAQIPLDPWGNPYFFDLDYDNDPGAGEDWIAVIGSFGPNGVGQNVYDEDNIIIQVR